VVAGDATSQAFRFWNRYARSRPGNFSFLFPFGMWVKPLAPDKVARAAIEPWVRRGNRVFGSLLRAIPPGNDPDVRVYRPEDLGACTRILEKATAGFDWALVWPAQRLAKQLESPVSRTLVVDRDGRVQGLVNYHFIMVHGREPVRAAIIDLWADDDLPAAQRARLLGHLCRELRARDVHMVTALRCAMMPAAAFAANFFLPIPRGFHMAALLARRGMSLPRPKRWSLLAR
jgi:hypothetical protein